MVNAKLDCLTLRKTLPTTVTARRQLMADG
jgi:hypothetical protein